MNNIISTSLGTTLIHCLDNLLLKRNKALTLEYWTSSEYRLHRRINERARLHSMYKTRLIASTVGMVINALLYRINSDADSLLIRK